MAANYPNALPSSTPADHQKVSDEQVAIATELGLNPRGTYADVAARLTALGSGGGGTSGLTWEPQSGSWCAPWLSPSSSSAGGYGTYQVIFPFALPYALTTQTMRLEVTTAGAAIGVGYYPSLSNGLPDWPNLVSFGTMDGSAVGVKDVTRPTGLVTIPANRLFWLTMTSTTTYGLRTLASAFTTVPSVPMPIDMTPPTASGLIGYSVYNGTTAPLTAQPPSGWLSMLAGSPPRVYFRNDAA